MRSRFEPLPKSQGDVRGHFLGVGAAFRVGLRPPSPRRSARGGVGRGAVRQLRLALPGGARRRYHPGTPPGMSFYVNVVSTQVVSERLPRQAPLRGPCRGMRVGVLAERALKLERTVFNVLLVYRCQRNLQDCNQLTTRVAVLGRGSPPQDTQNGCGCTSSSVRAVGRRDVSTS